MASAKTTYEAVVTEQKLSKDKNGDAILNLVVEVLGTYKDPYDLSFGINRFPQPEKQKITLWFNSMGLEESVKQMEKFGVAPGSFKLENLHPASSNPINAVGKKVPVYLYKNETTGKETWKISKYAGGSSPAPVKEFSIEDLKAKDAENQDIYERVSDPSNVPFGT